MIWFVRILVVLVMYGVTTVTWYLSFTSQPNNDGLPAVLFIVGLIYATGATVCAVTLLTKLFDF